MQNGQGHAGSSAAERELLQCLGVIRTCMTGCSTSIQANCIEPVSRCFAAACHNAWVYCLVPAGLMARQFALWQALGLWRGVDSHIVDSRDDSQIRPGGGVFVGIAGIPLVLIGLPVAAIIRATQQASWSQAWQIFMLPHGVLLMVNGAVLGTFGLHDVLRQGFGAGVIGRERLQRIGLLPLDEATSERSLATAGEIEPLVPSASPGPVVDDRTAWEHLRENIAGPVGFATVATTIAIGAGAGVSGVMIATSAGLYVGLTGVGTNLLVVLRWVEAGFRMLWAGAIDCVPASIRRDGGLSELGSAPVSPIGRVFGAIPIIIALSTSIAADNTITVMLSSIGIVANVIGLRTLLDTAIVIPGRGLLVGVLGGSLSSLVCHVPLEYAPQTLLGWVLPMLINPLVAGLAAYDISGAIWPVVMSAAAATGVTAVGLLNMPGILMLLGKEFFRSCYQGVLPWRLPESSYIDSMPGWQRPIAAALFAITGLGLHFGADISPVSDVVFAALTGTALLGVEQLKNLVRLVLSASVYGSLGDRLYVNTLFRRLFPDYNTMPLSNPIAQWWAVATSAVLAILSAEFIPGLSVVSAIAVITGVLSISAIGLLPLIDNTLTTLCYGLLPRLSFESLWLLPTLWGYVSAPMGRALGGTVLAATAFAIAQFGLGASPINVLAAVLGTSVSATVGLRGLLAVLYFILTSLHAQLTGLLPRNLLSFLFGPCGQPAYGDTALVPVAWNHLAILGGVGLWTGGAILAGAAPIAASLSALAGGINAVVGLGRIFDALGTYLLLTAMDWVNGVCALRPQDSVIGGMPQPTNLLQILFSISTVAAAGFGVGWAVSGVPGALIGTSVAGISVVPGLARIVDVLLLMPLQSLYRGIGFRRMPVQIEDGLVALCEGANCHAPSQWWAQMLGTLYAAGTAALITHSITDDPLTMTLAVLSAATVGAIGLERVKDALSYLGERLGTVCAWIGEHPWETVLLALAPFGFVLAPVWHALADTSSSLADLLCWRSGLEQVNSYPLARVVGAAVGVGTAVASVASIPTTAAVVAGSYIASGITNLANGAIAWCEQAVTGHRQSHLYEQHETVQKDAADKVAQDGGETPNPLVNLNFSDFYLAVLDRLNAEVSYASWWKRTYSYSQAERDLRTIVKWFNRSLIFDRDNVSYHGQGYQNAIPEHAIDLDGYRVWFDRDEEGFRETQLHIVSELRRPASRAGASTESCWAGFFYTAACKATIGMPRPDTYVSARPQQTV